MDAATYILLNKKIKSILPGYSYKGGVATVDDLHDDATTGDLYTVGGVQYVWNGTSWITVMEPVASKVQIDALFS